MSSISRIAVALERIAAALEKHGDPVVPEGSVRVNLAAHRQESARLATQVVGGTSSVIR